MRRNFSRMSRIQHYVLGLTVVRSRGDADRDLIE